MTDMYSLLLRAIADTDKQDTDKVADNGVWVEGDIIICAFRQQANAFQTLPCLANPVSFNRNGHQLWAFGRGVIVPTQADNPLDAIKQAYPTTRSRIWVSDGKLLFRHLDDVLAFDNLLTACGYYTLNSTIGVGSEYDLWWYIEAEKI